MMQTYTSQLPSSSPGTTVGRWDRLVVTGILSHFRSLRRTSSQIWLMRHKSELLLIPSIQTKSLCGFNNSGRAHIRPMLDFYNQSSINFLRTLIDKSKQLRVRWNRLITTNLQNFLHCQSKWWVFSMSNSSLRDSTFLETKAWAILTYHYELKKNSSSDLNPL